VSCGVEAKDCLPPSKLSGNDSFSPPLHPKHANTTHSTYSPNAAHHARAHRPHPGRIEVDQSALTGESLPVTMYVGDSAKMGSTITRGEVEATVEFTGKHTFFGKTATMLQQADGMGHLQKILMMITLALVVLRCAGGGGWGGRGRVVRGRLLGLAA